MSAQDLIAEAEEHRPRMRFFEQQCTVDRHPWPCLVRRLADELATTVSALAIALPIEQEETVDLLGALEKSIDRTRTHRRSP